MLTELSLTEKQFNIGRVITMIQLTLRAIRASLGLNQQDAAKRIGVSPDTLRSWENAKTFPDVPQIEKIEEVYGVKYNEIIFAPTSQLN